MDRKKVKRTILEATRFIEKATDLLKAMESTEAKDCRWPYPKESGATRRASMDLTRSLSDMRRAR